MTKQNKTNNRRKNGRGKKHKRACSRQERTDENATQSMRSECDRRSVMEQKLMALNEARTNQNEDGAEQTTTKRRNRSAEQYKMKSEQDSAVGS